MPGKGHSPEQVLNKLRQVDVAVSGGKSVGQAVRGIGVTDHTYYRWRREFGAHNIQANAIAPTVTNTPMGDSSWPPGKRRDAKLSRIPTGRFAESEEVANAVLFFASSQSDFVNGVEMSLDGGEGAT